MHTLRTTLIAAALAVAALVPAATASALEVVNVSAKNPALSFDAGSATGKRLWLIGDSLTNDYGGVQTNLDVWYFTAAGWRTRFEATAGATLADHWSTNPKWRTFERARADKTMQAVFVELGTNDASKLSPKATNYAVQLALINSYLTKTAEYLRASGKCVVLMGVDARGNGFVDSTVGKYYNDRAKALSTGKVHYADYHTFVATNAIYRAGVYQGVDNIHPKTSAAKDQLAQWIRDQTRWFCGI